MHGKECDFYTRKKVSFDRKLKLLLWRARKLNTLRDHPPPAPPHSPSVIDDMTLASITYYTWGRRQSAFHVTGCGRYKVPSPALSDLYAVEYFTTLAHDPSSLPPPGLPPMVYRRHTCSSDFHGLWLQGAACGAGLLRPRGPQRSRSVFRARWVGYTDLCVAYRGVCDPSCTRVLSIWQPRPGFVAGSWISPRRDRRANRWDCVSYTSGWVWMVVVGCGGS